MSGLIHFSHKQLRVLTWWCRDNRHDAIIADGSVRSGKTLSMGLGFIFWAQKCFNLQQFALCGKTIGALRRNLLRDLLPRLREMGFTCTERRGDNSVTIRFGGHENRFLLFGGRDESSAALIQGSTFAGVLLDEVALMPRSFVEQALARCSVTGSRLWFNCNPEGPQHWFYREWIQQAEAHHALYLHFTMDDNPGLSPKVRARYKNSYSGVFYRRFVLGEWTAAEGLVYDFFDRERDCMPPPRECARWRVSVDYGTSNPASFGLWGEQDGIWYRVREFYYDSHTEGRQKTDAEYVEDMRRLIGGRKVEKIVADPSAASFITALRCAGFPVIKADNDVLNGIRVTADLLKNGRMVLCDTCADCLREMELYCWENSADREKPKKENDHAMDDMRYFAMSITKSTEFSATWVERKTS